MSDLTKSSKKLVREVYTYTFDETLGTSLSIGSNSTVSNSTYPLYDKDLKHVGFTMGTRNTRESTSDNYNYENIQVGFFLNDNKDLLSINFNLVSSLKTSAGIANTEVLAKATYGSGKYQGKDVTVNIKYLKDYKRKVIITYKE